MDEKTVLTEDVLEVLNKVVHIERQRADSMCQVRSSRRFYCCRRAGHEGRHIATTATQVVDIWTDMFNMEEEQDG